MAIKIIAVANSKGGVGKTTVALQIAIARALEGKEVWFVDGDRQQTGQTALAIRETQDAARAQLASAAYATGPLLASQVRRQAPKWDNVVIDVGGFDSAAMRAALALCDILVVPFQPRSFDTWGLAGMASLIEEVQAIRGDFPVCALLNAADPQDSSDNRDAAAALADFPMMKLLGCRLCRRKAYSNASGFGLSVMESRPKDPKAVAEVAALMQALFAGE